MDNLLQFRQALNLLDEQIVQLLGKRFAIVRAVGQYKSANDIPMMQAARVAEVKERCAQLAQEHGMDPEFARRLYSIIIDEACRLEDEIIENSPDAVSSRSA